MLNYFDLRKGVLFILEGQPYEVLEFKQMGKAQDVVVAQTKIKNLVNGKTVLRSFHQSDTFQEAEIERFTAKFIYNRKEKYIFSEATDASKRFELLEDQIGAGARFLKTNEIVDGLRSQGKIINVSVPVKVQLRVSDAPPGVQGDRSQGGTKSVTLETGATLNVPLFVQTDDIVEVNTETGEYARRV